MMIFKYDVSLSYAIKTDNANNVCVLNIPIKICLFWCVINTFVELNCQRLPSHFILFLSTEIFGNLLANFSQYLRKWCKC